MKTTDICDIEFTKYIPGKNKNIISVAFFLMRESYKDISKYLRGMTAINSYIEVYNTAKNSKHKPIYLRVYHDQSLDLSEDPRIIELMVNLRRNPYTELVLYKPGKYVQDQEYVGLFGTIIRFFPFFAFDDNDVEHYFVSDIDFSEYGLEMKKEEYIVRKLEYIIENNVGFFYDRKLCYDPFWNKGSLLNKHAILAGMIGGNVKVDPEILKYYLDELINNKSKDIIIYNFKKIYLENILGIEDLNNSKEKVLSYRQNTIFVYGFDEFFLLYYVFPEILKQHVKIVEHLAQTSRGISKVVSRFMNSIIKKIKLGNDRIKSNTIHFYKHLFTTLEPEIIFIEQKYKNNNNKMIINNNILKNNTITNNSKLINKNKKNMTDEEYIINLYNRLIKIFNRRDYEGKKPEIHELYNHFYQIMSDQNKMNKNILMVMPYDNDNFSCFLENNVSLNDTNNLIEMPIDKQNEIYELILKDIQIIKNKYKNIFKNKSIKTTKRKTTKRKTTKRKTTKIYIDK